MRNVAVNRWTVFTGSMRQQPLLDLETSAAGEHHLALDPLTTCATVLVLVLGLQGPNPAPSDAQPQASTALPIPRQHRLSCDFDHGNRPAVSDAPYHVHHMCVGVCCGVSLHTHQATPAHQ